MVKVEDITKDKLRNEQVKKQVRGLVKKAFEGFKIKEDDEHIKVLKKRKPIFTLVFNTNYVIVTNPFYEDEARQIANEYEEIISKEPTLLIDYSKYRTQHSGRRA